MRIADLQQIDLENLSSQQLQQLKSMVVAMKYNLKSGFSIARTKGCVSSHLPKIGGKPYLYDCSCLTCVGGNKIEHLDEWHRRLLKSRIDNQGKRYIVELEREIVQDFDLQKKNFIEECLKLYKEKGHLTFDDVNRFLTTNLDKVSGTAVSPFLYYTKYLSDAARGSAYKRLGYDREGARKMIRKADYDANKRRLEDYVGESMSLVKSVPQETIDRLKGTWIEQGSPGNVVRTMLGFDEEAIRMGLSDRQMRDALADMWTKQRYTYQRIVRTESVNLYAAIQLQEWYDQGVREVERNSIGDLRTCLLCRELSSPGRNIYLIEDLLKERYPVSFMSHPLCRCGYTPIINFSVFDELEKELMAVNPPNQFDLAQDMQVGDVVLEMVPIEFDEEVRKIIQETPPNSTVSFVPDITNDYRWRTEKLEELKERYPSNRDAEIALEQEIKDMRGKIISYVTKDTETALISGFAIEALPVTAPVARLSAEQQWGSLTPQQKGWVINSFKNRKRIVNRQDDGHLSYEIVNQFVTPLSEIDEKGYFVESYIYYLVNPIKLYYCDRGMYDWLRENFFHKDYIEDPIR